MRLLLTASLLAATSGCISSFGMLDYRNTTLYVDYIVEDGVQTFPTEVSGLDFKEDGSIVPFTEAGNGPSILLQALPREESLNWFPGPPRDTRIYAATARVEGALPRAFGLQDDVHLTSINDAAFKLTEGKVDLYTLEQDHKGRALAFSTIDSMLSVNHLSDDDYMASGTRPAFSLDHNEEGKLVVRSALGTSRLLPLPLTEWKNPFHESWFFHYALCESWIIESPEVLGMPSAAPDIRLTASDVGDVVISQGKPDIARCVKEHDCVTAVPTVPEGG